jgi:hypothetical protein
VELSTEATHGEWGICRGREAMTIAEGTISFPGVR